jgi:CBS domain-containing protein
MLIIARSSMTLEEARATVRSRTMSVLIIYQGDEPVRALPARDLIEDGTPGNDVSKRGTLQELLTHRVAVRCREDAILADAMQAMIRHRVSHVPVLDATGGLVGALSLVDAVGAVSPAAAERWSARMKGWAAAPPPSK